jgi:predicted AlkP superfamily phosphohydrolase/phosphomutase
MSRPAPVVMLGLDAAELTLIERWIGEGRLPGLESLARRGRFGTLESPAASYAGGVWPSFYAGVDVSVHGLFHNKQWRPDAMRVEVPTDRWLGNRPFWEIAGEQGRRVCVIDVPMVLGRPKPLNGIHLSGWGTHDLIASGSWPRNLWRELARRHGRPTMPPERYGRQDAAGLLRLRDALLRSTEQALAIASDLLSREAWDLACVVFGATHRAGHYLWDLSQLDADASHPGLESALAEIYQCVDHAVARLIERVDPEARICVFAVHGMGPNPGWSDVFPRMLERIHATQTGRAAKRGALYAIKQRLPFEWARPVVTRLPSQAAAALIPLWSARMFDWSTTRFFPVPMDHAGYVRISLRGRERDGIVEGAAAYAEVCDLLVGAIGALHDADTGRSIAATPARAWLDCTDAAPRRDNLPDLVVQWAGPRCCDVRRVACDVLPGFEFPVPPHLPSGRSGNHTNRAWFIAAGTGIAASRRPIHRDIRDLAPTVLSWLEVEPDARWQGRTLPLGADEPRDDH